VAGDASDTATALRRIDALIYGKGATVLRQLAERVGQEPFLAAVRVFLKRHAGGNATTADLCAVVEEVTLSTPTRTGGASGEPLEVWARHWLHTPGVTTLRPHVRVENGLYTAAAIEQCAPNPDAVHRPHTLRIGLYDRTARGLLPRTSLPVRIDGPLTDVPSLVGQQSADLLLINDGDVTWASIVLDPYSLDTVLTGLADLRDPLARALVTQSLWDGVADGHLPAGRFFDAAVAALPHEGDPSLLTSTVERLRTVVDRWGDQARRPARLARLALACRDAAPAHPPPERLRLVQELVDAVVDPDTLLGWLSGTPVMEGITLTADLRWRILRRLAILDALDVAAIDAERDRDPTASGRAAALGVQTARPCLTVKRAAMDRIGHADGNNHDLLALAGALFPADQVEQTRPLVGELLERLPGWWRLHPPWLAAQLTRAAFPVCHVDQSTVDAVEHVLSGDLEPGPHAVLTGLLLELSRATRIRATDRAGGGNGRGQARSRWDPTHPDCREERMEGGTRRGWAGRQDRSSRVESQ
jgi:aminopeptidase N